MKLSIAITILILALAATWGVRDQRRHAKLLETQETLVAEARALGIDPEAATSPQARSRPRVSARESEADRAQKAREMAAKLSSLLIRGKEMEARGEHLDHQREMQEQGFALIREMMDFDATQFRIMVEEIRNSTELGDEEKQQMIGISLMMLSEDQPAAAMAMLDQAGDLLGEDGMRDHFISSSLSNWSREDPLAALEWLRENGEKHSDETTSRAFNGIVSGVAVNDPRLALALVGEFGPEDSPSLVRQIGAMTRTPERRDEFLAALREQMAEGGDAEQNALIWEQALNGIAQPLFREGFDAATAWLDSSGLTEEEMAPILSSVGYHRNSDFGKWFEWVADKTPDDTRRQTLGASFSSWVQNDHISAAEWLDQAAPGPLRETALEQYVQAAAHPRPDLAAARVDEMPAGEIRDSLIRRIHGAWQNQDPAAAADFAARHGLEP